MVFDIGCLRVKLIFGRENYNTYSDVWECILITKTNALNSVPHQPSGGAMNMSVQNEISYETTYYIVFAVVVQPPYF